MKPLIAALLFVSFAFSTTAQVTTGVKLGASFASLRFKGDDNNQGRLAGYGGLAVNIVLQNQFFFQPELLYSIRGYRYPSTGFNSEGRVSFGYITLPLLIGYKATNNLSVSAGPELGYLVRARSHFDGSSHDIMANVGKLFNLDVDAGLTWNITTDLKIETRFSFGLMPVFKGVYTDPQGTPLGEFKDGYHRVLQLGILHTL